MGEIDENPVLDYDELNSYIQGRTGLDYDTVANVLDLEISTDVSVLTYKEGHRLPKISFFMLLYNKCTNSWKPMIKNT